ncbi:unnamed protein product [Nippostrongylus brasiliensis]|uniref:Dehydrogenase/reductase SDR family member 13 (inferred by orthology to a human protein) n=1 Tax=Nippostrongylus brasiliensis TaxID=27835 RepID=A0A158QX37_NIPBR|nr:unnamed protein product [Nippostrongylus brasiliensis]
MLHPDKGNNGDSTSAFVDLKEAYDVLRRPVDRRAYDDSQRNLQEQIYRDPYYHYNPYRDQQRQRESQWSRVWRENPGTTGHMKDSDFQRRSNDQWYFILKWTVIGTFLVFLYNIGFVMQLKYRERRLAKLVDEDEIAKSFMRQPEMVEIGRILKGDIDEAWKRRNEGLQGKNPNEIREEYRWLRAVQDADHTRRVKAERSERRLHTAKDLYLRGASVILTCRDEVRGRAAVEAVQSQLPEGGGSGTERLHLFTLDLSCYKSILSFCNEIKSNFDRIDVLINNAGVMGLAFELSRNGIEMHFATNAFGHYVLVNNLLPLLEKGSDSRIVIVSSGLYKGVNHIPTLRQLMGEQDWDYQSRYAYAISKLANCLHTVELANFFSADRVNAANMWEMFYHMEELILIRCHTLSEDERHQAEEAMKVLSLKS